MKRTVIGVLLAGAAIVLPVAADAGMLDRTIRALEALSAKGSARAQYELGLHFEEAKGVTRDNRRALFLYCKAARQGHADAAYRAGRMIQKGNAGLKDEALGHAWLRTASSLGSGDAARVVKASTSAKAPDRCEPPQLRYFAVPPVPPAHVKAMVHKLAPTYRLDPQLVLAVIAVESAYRSDVVSPKNAMGLMQLIPETAERFGVGNVFSPEDNIRGGMKYLRWLLAFFEGDVTLALAAYNAGEGAVLQYKGVPPYRETQDYITKIRTVYQVARHPFDPKIVDPAGLRGPRGERELVAELSTPKAEKKTVKPAAKPARRTPDATVAQSDSATIAE